MALSIAGQQPPTTMPDKHRNISIVSIAAEQAQTISIVSIVAEQAQAIDSLSACTLWQVPKDSRFM